ncbi:flagellar basal body P-ring formation chaperone FlgA [Thiomicrorhabdus hydrogeniphila]
MKTTKLLTILVITTNMLLVNSHVLANQTTKIEASQPKTETQSYQSLDEIHQLVTKHVKQKIDQKIFDPKIQLRKLSPQLHLPQCKTPLQLVDKDLENIVGRITISVLCEQPKWRVYVPVIVEGNMPVIISTHGILKRAVIKAEDVQKTLLNYKNVPSGAMININKVIGMRTKSSIGPNRVIKINDLQPQFWVFKDKQVDIITRIGGIEVKTRGTALNDAVADEQVKIKNNASEKIIKGIVIAPNKVLVP